MSHHEYPPYIHTQHTPYISSTKNDEGYDRLFDLRPGSLPPSEDGSYSEQTTEHHIVPGGSPDTRALSIISSSPSSSSGSDLSAKPRSSNQPINPFPVSSFTPQLPNPSTMHTGYETDKFLLEPYHPGYTRPGQPIIRSIDPPPEEADELCGGGGLEPLPEMDDQRHTPRISGVWEVADVNPGRDCPELTQQHAWGSDARNRGREAARSELAAKTQLEREKKKALREKLREETRKKKDAESQKAKGKNKQHGGSSDQQHECNGESQQTHMHGYSHQNSVLDQHGYSQQDDGGNQFGGEFIGYYPEYDGAKEVNGGYEYHGQYDGGS